MSPVHPLIINALRYVIVAGLAFVIFYKWKRVYFSSNKIQSRRVSKRDLLRETIQSFQTISIFALVSLAVFSTPLKGYLKIYHNASDMPIIWIPISILLMLILHDTYFYWMHRIIHHPTLFKRIHLVHHKSTNPTPLASYSFHFLESFLESLFAPILLITIPAHPLALLAFSSLAFVFNVYGHLGYEIMPKWFRKSVLFEVVNTSIYHNLHHARFNGNYGLYFRFWDRLMKTESPLYTAEYDRIQRNRFSDENRSASFHHTNDHRSIQKSHP